MAYSQKIKEYAKELYLTVGNDGNHKYILEEIIEKIEKKLKKNEKIPTVSTLHNWINTKDKTTKKSWKDIWKSGVKSGIEQANVDIENSLDAEERIEINIDNIIRLRANNAIKIQENFEKKLKNKNVDYRDIAEMKLSEMIFNNLNLELGSTDEHDSVIDDNDLRNILEEEGYCDEEIKDIIHNNDNSS